MFSNVVSFRVLFRVSLRLIVVADMTFLGLIKHIVKNLE